VHITKTTPEFETKQGVLFKAIEMEFGFKIRVRLPVFWHL
jgi:hypothetical protein